MKIRRGASLKDVTGAAAYVGGALVQVRRIAHFDGSAVNTIKTFVDGLTVNASPTAPTATISGAGTATTPPTTATPLGGVGPYTYSWAKLSGSGAINSPANATTSFSQFVSSGARLSGEFQCTVTDASGEIATDQVIARFNSVA